MSIRAWVRRSPPSDLRRPVDGEAGAMLVGNQQFRSLDGARPDNHPAQLVSRSEELENQTDRIEGKQESLARFFA